MSTLNKRIAFRLSEGDLAMLMEKSKTAHLTRGAFLRHCIRDKEIKAAPTVETGRVLYDLRLVQNSLNRLMEGVEDNADTELQQAAAYTERARQAVAAGCLGR